MRRAIGRFDSRVENPHPRRAGNRKLSLPHIVLKGLRTAPFPPPTALLIRGAQGDSSRYSLLMGVLFSDALSSLETCHASLASPRISHRTTFDTDNAVRTSKIVRSQGIARVRPRFTYVCRACYSRARVARCARACESPCGDTFAKRAKNAPTRVPLDQRQSAVKQ